MSDRMSDETFEAMLRSKGYGDLDASLALNVEARRARKAEDDLRAQLAAVTAERDALKELLGRALESITAMCGERFHLVPVIRAALSPAQTKP